MKTSRRRVVWIGCTALACAIAITAFGFHLSRAPNANMALAKGQFKRASELFHVAAQAGDPVAQNALGNLYYVGLGVAKNYHQAKTWYTQSASAGNASAQLNLGHMYGQGLGVAQDPVKAFAWYNMANQYGNPAAEFYLTQISKEYTLTPLMIESAKKKYAKLSSLLPD